MTVTHRWELLSIPNTIVHLRLIVSDIFPHWLLWSVD